MVSLHHAIPSRFHVYRYSFPDHIIQCYTLTAAIVMSYSGSKKVMPFQTNVLYVFVPEDMIGGQLEAWPYDISPEDIAKGPHARVTPQENRMAFFRGDAQHQVRSYNTSSRNVLRGSLVLEQYNIPEDYVNLVEKFHWRDRDDSEMM